MFRWLKRLIDRRCEFYDKCDSDKVGQFTCENGPVYFDGIQTRSYCGKYRRLAGWSTPDWDAK
jgi:hypothetical protein